jgi:hypothetical protein
MKLIQWLRCVLGSEGHELLKTTKSKSPDDKKTRIPIWRCLKCWKEWPRES